MEEPGRENIADDMLTWLEAKILSSEEALAAERPGS